MRRVETLHVAGGTRNQIPFERSRARRRSRGSSVLEEILIVAAVLGCFVYPMSLAARAVGSRMAQSMDGAHRTLLTQSR